MRLARFNPLALAALAAPQGIPVHTDAVQAVGRVPVHFHELGVATLEARATNFMAQWESVYFWYGAASDSARGFSAVDSSKAGDRGPFPSLLS